MFKCTVLTVCFLLFCFSVSAEFLDYWLNSIHTHVHQAELGSSGRVKDVMGQKTSEEPYLSPPVIIVCTKKDIKVSLN